MNTSLSLRARIFLIVLLAVIGIAVLTVTSLFSTKRDLTQGRIQVIQSIVESAYSIVEHFHTLEKNGVMTRQEAQNAAAETLVAGRYGGADGKAEYVYAWTMEGVGVAHVNPAFIGNNMLNEIRDGEGRYILKEIVASLRTQPSGAFLDSGFVRPGGTVPVDKLLYSKTFQPWDWFIGTGIYMDDLAADLRRELLKDGLVSLLILLVIGVSGYLIALSILRQVGGEPALAIDLMSRAAKGDLTIHIDNAPPGSLLAGLESMVSSIRATVIEIRNESKNVHNNANTINQASADVAQAANDESEAITSMAAAIEEMTVSISHISESAKETEENSRFAAKMAQQGVTQVSSASNEINKIADMVKAASSKVGDLNANASRISSIASVIREIAEQTNLLALNAAIEAARAGDQGRGFAVVADEVRTLAARTATATSDIEKMIEGVLTGTAQVVETMEAALPQVEAGVVATESATALLAQIRQGAESTLVSVTGVANSTQEQTLASSSIAEKVDQIAQMMEITSGAMHSTAESAKELNHIASELNTMVSRFKC
ncbi:methyl-accepting chemotaxis protein [Nitrincola sp.]|uniref:methyl-accepting chemotaxis protein n=1 Tax=Nitrincola sp. TaxID=1926584 RepID=UPI003A938703